MWHKKVMLGLGLLAMPFASACGGNNAALDTSEVSGALTGPAISVVASGLNNPRGLAFNSKGVLFVTEAGNGGAGPCLPGPAGTLCYGTSGAVAKIQNKVVTRTVTGLSSFAAPDGTGAFGPGGISFDSSGDAYVPVGGCFGADPRPPTCGKLLRVKPNNTYTIFADPSAFEEANNPDGLHPFESNPLRSLATSGEVAVVDAAGNDVVRVASDGSISVGALIPNQTQNGAEVDSVPDTIARGPDGLFYVGELTGYPFTVGSAHIWRGLPGATPKLFASGFTTITEIAFDSKGRLLVLELATNGLLSGDRTGALKRVNKDGSVTTLLTTGLIHPTGMVVASDDSVYISNHGQESGTGEVIRVTNLPR